MRRPLLVAIWIIATAATTAVAYVAVNAAGAEVTDRPLTSVVATGPTSNPGVASTTVSPEPTSTTIPSATMNPTSGGGGTTGSTVNTPAISGATTSTTAPSPGPTSTTTSPAPWQLTTVPSRGGLVIVSYRPEEVRLESVAPSPGFGYEIDKAGPAEVRVEFEGADVKVEVRVRWDGGLVIEVDEN